MVEKVQNDELLEANEMVRRKEFDNAIRLLTNLIKDNDCEQKSYINYLLGIIYQDPVFSDRSESKAKDYYFESIRYEDAIEDAYIRLSYLEQNTNHAIRILKKGVQKHYNSINIYERLLMLSSDEGRVLLFEELDNNQLSNEFINIIKVQTYFNLGRYDDVLRILRSVDDCDYKGKLVLSVIEAFCLLEVGESQSAESVFLRIINDDLKNELDFIQYLGLVLLYLKCNRNEDAECFINDISVDGPILPVVHFVKKYMYEFDFEKHFLECLREIELKLKSRSVIAKARMMRGLYSLYYKNETNQKVAKDLEYSIKIYNKNKYLYDAIKKISRVNKKNIQAYEYFVRAKENGLIHKDDEYLELDFLVECDVDDILTIATDYKKRLEKSVDMKQYLSVFFDRLINRLYEMEKHSDIVSLADVIEMKYLDTDRTIFRIAYSYHQVKRIDTAITYYKYHLEIFGRSSGVLNNLGVMLEGKGELLKAKSLFMEAHLLDDSEETFKHNVKNIMDKIKKENENELQYIANNITIEKLESIGYDDNLLTALSKKTSNEELHTMLERDLKENVIALVSKSYKTSLILSGSIIEAMLLDKILSKNISTYSLANGRNKKVEQMDLNELLYIANSEKIIEDQLFHLSHALRGFRNLIHPGVEQRKYTINVSEDNAMIAWDIMRKIIIEL